MCHLVFYTSNEFKKNTSFAHLLQAIEVDENSIIELAIEKGWITRPSKKITIVELLAAIYEGRKMGSVQCSMIFDSISHLISPIKVGCCNGNPQAMVPIDRNLKTGHIVNVKIFLQSTNNAAIDNPQAMVPNDRPAPVAPWLAPPDVAKPPLPHKDIMSNFPTLRAG